MEGIQGLVGLGTTGTSVPLIIHIDAPLPNHTEIPGSRRPFTTRGLVRIDRWIIACLGSEVT